MATLRVLLDTKVIISKKKFEQYAKYNDLKKEIIDNSKKQNKVGDGSLKHTDNFILNYEKDDKGNYFPEELNNCIFNNQTFDFLKEKLSLRRIKDSIYRFKIEKVDKLPVWKKMEYDKILEIALESQWKPICDEIKREIGLKELEKSQLEYEKMKKELVENENNIKGVHDNIICNNCFKNNIKGKRFICSECFNYNLCQDCEKIYYKKEIHERKHTLIQVNKPLSKDEDNILKYGNVITKNIQEIKLSDIVDLEQCYPLQIEISSNGSNNLENCYILPVRYGEDYLTCIPLKINESMKQNFSQNFILMIKLPNLDKKYYEGYFRMFTPSGLPFGQIIFVKAYREE